MKLTKAVQKREQWKKMIGNGERVQHSKKHLPASCEYTLSKEILRTLYTSIGSQGRREFPIYPLCPRNNSECSTGCYFSLTTALQGNKMDASLIKEKPEVQRWVGIYPISHSKQGAELGLKSTLEWFQSRYSFLWILKQSIWGAVYVSDRS